MNSKVVKNWKKLFIIVIGLFFSIFVIYSFYHYFHLKKYYRVDSRIQNIKNAKLDLDSSFHVIGWLKVQAIDIDVPMVLADTGLDTEYPVTSENYVWTLNSDSKFHNQLNIIGHNIFNLSSQPKIKSSLFHRFEELMSFVYYDIAKDNKYIQVTIDGKDYLYKIFSSGFISYEEMDSFMEIDDFSKKGLKDNVDFWRKKSIYDYSVSVNENDNFVTLYTCTRFFGSGSEYMFYVTGRLLRNGEFVDNYSASKNNNYEKIESILKGDHTYEEYI